MADTVRTLDALLALLADNTSGDISPQDLRDYVVSAHSWLGGNLLINGAFKIAARVADPTASATVTDGGYDLFDRWYCLRQGANATITRVAGTDGTQFNAKMVAGGTTNRFGLAQNVCAEASIPMRGRVIRFQCRVKTHTSDSSNMSVRCAVLEWTGTADSPVKDVVNDWTSSTYTTGNFFTSTTLTLVGTATVSAAEGTWTDLAVTGTVSSSCNNLIVLVWHQAIPANSANYIEIAKAGLYDGSQARDWMPQPDPAEELLCLPYCQVIKSDGTATAARVGVGVALSTTSCRIIYPAVVPFRIVPTITATATDWQLFGSGSTDVTANLQVAAAGSTRMCLNIQADVASGLTAGGAYTLGADTNAGRILIFDAEIGA